MSMKSMTMRPPISRMRSCRAISSAASRLVLVAVVSMSLPRVARAELMSIDTSAIDRKSTRLNSSHVEISYAVFCLKKKNHNVYVLDEHVGMELRDNVIDVMV